MGITTRAGVARILEYNKNYGLISITESSKRIIIVLQTFAFLFCFYLQFILLIISNTIHNGTENFLLVGQRPTPKLNYHIQSILLNGSVCLLPILQTSNSSLISNKLLDIFSFPKSEIKFAYQYRGDLVYFYSSFNEEYSFSVVYSVTSEKYTMKKYFRDVDMGYRYKLPKNVSMVEIGPYLWLYGMYVIYLICKKVYLEKLSSYYYF